MSRLLLLPLLAAVALSDEFDAELATARTGGPAELAALSAKSGDPWLLAELLCHEGAFDRAAALAEAASVRTADAGALPAYVASLKGRDLAAARERYRALRESRKRREGGDAGGALPAIEAVTSLDEDLTSTLVVQERGILYWQLGRMAEAGATLADAAQRAARLGCAGLSASCWRGSGWAFYRLTDFRQARESWGRWVEGERARGRSYRLAESLGRLCYPAAATGDGELAVRSGSEALLLFEELGSADANVVDTLGSMAIVQRERAEYEASERYAARALEMARVLNEERLVSFALSQVAATRYARGDYRGAREASAEALAVAEATGNPSKVASSLGDYGWACYVSGDWARGLTLIERALAMAREQKDLRLLSTNSMNLGAIRNAFGDHERAAACYGEAASLAERMGWERQRIQCRLYEGNCWSRLGRTEEAVRRFESVFADAERLGDPETASWAVGQLAVILDARGDHGAARPFHRRALGLAVRAGNLHVQAEALCRIGAGQVHSGEVDEGVRSLEEARTALGDLDEPRLHGQICWAFASARRAQGRLDDAVAEAERALRITVGQFAGLSAGENAAARAAAAAGMRQGIDLALATGRPETVLRFADMARAGALVDALNRQGALEQAVVPPQLRQREAEARGREGLAQRRLAQARAGGERTAIAKARAEHEAARVALQDVAQQIRRESGLGARVLFPEPATLRELLEALRADEALVLYLLQGETAHALVVTAGRAAIVDLGARAGLREDEGHLIAPLALGAGIRRVYVSPDGALGLVPFAALDPEREYVLVPSVSTFLRLDRAARGNAALALGDPAYGDAKGRLPATRAEAEAVGGTVLLGQEATETRLLAEIAKAGRLSVLHLACHGLVDPRNPLLSALAVTPDASSDGFLTALEISALKIPADLVVLSACDTGQGKVFEGEGLVGFASTFLIAGASRVVVSLWKVDDEATAALMAKFYELRRGAGADVATALRAAQRHVRAQPRWADPRYWAAWQLWGLG